MIAEAVFVMTILGCGNEGDACDFVAEPQITYASRLECESKVESVLPTYQAAAYPVLVGDCSEKPGEIHIVQLENNLTDETPISVQNEVAEPSTFEQLRAKADAFEFDPFGRVNAFLERTSETAQNLINRTQSLLNKE